MPTVAELSPDQQQAASSILDWRVSCSDEKQVFTLGGLAGTGKSTLVAYLAVHLPNPVVVCPTGKAASLLQGKGVDARTIHSVVYRPLGKGNQIDYRLRFDLDADTIIVDEASMVSKKLHNDLCRLGKPILYVGDHGQLEPIGENAHLMENPDVRLETIHRQAEKSPIIRLATAFRERRDAHVRRAMGHWRNDQCVLTVRARLDDYLTSGMQVIVGFNKIRHALNARIRDRLGHKGAPAPCEKVICLRNNAKFGLFNGQECVVADVLCERRGIIELEIITDDGRRIIVPCPTWQFGVDTIKEHQDTGVVLMDFGYAITVHKAQGSTWNEVLVVESIARSWDARRWRYTAVTRAAERIVYCF